MKSNNGLARLAFALASAFSTAVTFGSVLALADHYSDGQAETARTIAAAQWR